MSNHTNNVWEYAKYHVGNKSIHQRVWHSPKLHELRSAVSSRGSALSKGAKLGGNVTRTVLGLVPIPALATILSGVQTKIEEKYREYLRGKKLDGLASTDPEFVKFSIKDASIEEMDRMRWKAEHDLTELQRVGQKWGEARQDAAGRGAVCDFMADAARHVAQAERRLDIFEKKVAEIKALMLACEIWSSNARKSIDKFRQEAEESFAELAKIDQQMGAYAADNHLNCGAFCIHGGRGEINRRRDQVINAAAVATTMLTDLGDIDSFLSLNRETFTVTDSLGPYRASSDD
ncbi:hypothetical protein D0849_04575 [Bordetella avium]|uniref:hypothetical protein n=1 Tax=Bordetella avium TaxID=521 RepID=UPI000E69B49F|nr:hypothetical protein [Bordetella avium]AZY47949.1 hypothetical protein C0J09_01445 [Bordetella avium]RIQ18684.1 hypothetical protein D0850_06365 [Bordetella avium]RIQ35280.1 hypothetical protein D0849_04575 [Bordetella avium]